MHPIFMTVLRGPELLAAHLADYAALVNAEADGVNSLRSRCEIRQERFLALAPMSYGTYIGERARFATMLVSLVQCSSAGLRGSGRSIRSRAVDVSGTMLGFMR